MARGLNRTVAARGWDHAAHRMQVTTASPGMARAFIGPEAEKCALKYRSALILLTGFAKRLKRNEPPRRQERQEKKREKSINSFLVLFLGFSLAFLASWRFFCSSR
jgi:hypothetical protein